jgi:ribonuclease D
VKKMAKVLGVNVETAGAFRGDALNPLSPTSKVVLFQFGNQRRIFVCDPRLIPHFKNELESHEFLHVGHNLVHDFKFCLAKYDVHIGRRYDTMLAEQLLSAGLEGTHLGLQDLAPKYPPHREIGKAIREQFFEHAGPLTAEQIHYAAQHVYVLFDIFRGQYATLDCWATKFEEDNLLEASRGHGHRAIANIFDVAREEFD